MVTRQAAELVPAFGVASRCASTRLRELQSDTIALALAARAARSGILDLVLEATSVSSDDGRRSAEAHAQLARWCAFRDCDLEREMPT